MLRQPAHGRRRSSGAAPCPAPPQAAILAAPWLDNGNPLPTHCALHGEPATASRKLKILTPAPTWMFALIIVGVLPFLLANHFLRKHVTATAWPFCAHCKRERLIRLAKGLGLFAAGVVLFAISDQVDSDASTYVGIAAVFALLFGAFLARRGLWRHVAGAYLADDRHRVIVQPAHSAFAADIAPEARIALPTPPGIVHG